MMSLLNEYIQLCKDFKQFQNTAIPLCAAENYVSDCCMSPLISAFEGKYSFVDSSGNNSFIGGEYIERLNILLAKQCNALFNATYVNTETLTGINCFTVCAMSLLSADDIVLVTTPEQGGHPSIPIILDKLGIKYESIPYNYQDFQIDYNQLNELCQSNKYSFIIFCQSDVINPPDLRNIHISAHMGIIYDSTQTLGLIVSKVVPNPLHFFDKLVLIGGTHKTLPAPSCGLIMTNNKTYQDLLQKHITPDLLRNTQPNHSASLLLSLFEQERYGMQYQNLVVDLANMLGEKLIDFNFNVAKLDDGKFTHTHQLFMIMPPEECEDFFLTAKKYNITLNKKHKKLFHNDGIRIGTQQIARYNWSEKEIEKLALLLSAIKTKEIDKISNLRFDLISKKNPCFTFEDISIE